MMNNLHSGAKAYQQVNRFTGVEGASPHQLIDLLMRAALEKIATAKGLMERRELSAKGEMISRCIAIVDELRHSLDLEKGGDIANNLYNLYIYMTTQMMQANLDNDTRKLDEVTKLLSGLRETWNAIPLEQRYPPAAA